MYKHTVIFYPHIVKQYESVEQYITENGYEAFVEQKYSELENNIGINRDDSTRFALELSEDGFEVVMTIGFADENDWMTNGATIINEYDMKRPIFQEEFNGGCEHDLF